MRSLGVSGHTRPRGIIGKPDGESTWQVRVSKDPNRRFRNWRWELRENGKHIYEREISVIPPFGFNTYGHSWTHEMALKAASRHLRKLLKRREAVQTAKEEATTYPL